MNTRKTLKTLAALALLALPAVPFAAAPAFGHGAEVGPMGGKQTHAGPLHAEVLVEGQSLTVYMWTMQDDPIPTDGAEGTATVLVGGKPETVALAPAGGNSLKGTGSFATGQEAKVVLTVKLAGKGPVQARYTFTAAEMAGGGTAGKHQSSGMGH